MRKKYIRVPRYIRNGRFVRGYRRLNPYYNRRRIIPSEQYMHRLGIRETYLPHDAEKLNINKEWWFTPPEKYDRVDKTVNWWRFRIRDPQEFDSFFVKNIYNDDKSKIIKQIVFGKSRNKNVNEIQSIRYPISSDGISCVVD